jgi:hypothetical protein
MPYGSPGIFPARIERTRTNLLCVDGWYWHVTKNLPQQVYEKHAAIYVSRNEYMLKKKKKKKKRG